MSRKNNGLNFASDLYKKILEEKPNENFIFSPFSIQILLAMLYSGTEGDSAKEISKLLKSLNRVEIEENFKDILNINQINKQLHMANKLYAQNGNEFIDDFNKIAMEYYRSDTENVDFTKSEETAKKVNEWIESKTTGKIQNIIKLDELQTETKLAIINALYLKANWENYFLKVSTYKGDFWNNDSVKVETDFMSVYEGYFQYYDLKDLNAKALQLNYEAYQLKLLIIVPNNKNGLNDLEKNIQDLNIFEISEQCKETLINLSIPKFNIEFSMDMVKVLNLMGIKSIFSDNANFSNSIVNKDQIKISHIIHKISYDVNEEGTEAVPPTPSDFNICICPGCHKVRPINLTIDHPFLYAVKDSNTIYYFGRVKSM